VHVDDVEENVDSMDMGLLNVGDGWERVSFCARIVAVELGLKTIDLGLSSVGGGWEWAAVSMSGPVTSLNTMTSSLSSLNTMTSSSLISYSVSPRGFDVSDVSDVSSSSSFSVSVISESSSETDSAGPTELDRLDPLLVIDCDQFSMSSSDEVGGSSLELLSAPIELQHHESSSDSQLLSDSDIFSEPKRLQVHNTDYK